MYSEDKISELFGESSLQYVKRKYRGGSSNEKGNAYENFYAVYKIALLSPNVIEQCVEIKFYSQALSFVDDLIISYEAENRLRHHQLKNSSSIVWGNKSQSISSDFYKQHILNQAINKASEMVLVVSDSQLQQRLESSCPQHIKK